ncbi:ARID DNA-binding domain-containing protein [Tanacetum coccineum]
MVNTNTYLEDKWTRLHKRGIIHYNSWHQSKHEKPLRKRMQNVFIQRQIRREKESRLGNCIKQISKECKEMLRKKIEEIEVYNHALPQPHNDSKKHRRYKCYECRIRGHIANNCPNKGKISESTNSKKISERVHTQILYPESIHLPTDFMIDGTDEGTWDRIWYISKHLERHVCSNRNLFGKLKEKFSVEKLQDIHKLLFIHGVGEINIKIGKEIFCIPGVL